MIWGYHHFRKPPYVSMSWFAAFVPSVLLSSTHPVRTIMPLSIIASALCFPCHPPFFSTIQTLNVNVSGPKWAEPTGWCNYHWVIRDDYTKDVQQLCLLREWVRNKHDMMLLMEEILHQLRLVVYPIMYRIFLHPRWCWISSINSMK